MNEINLILLIMGTALVIASTVAIFFAYSSHKKKQQLATMNYRYQEASKNQTHAEQNHQNLQKALLQGQKLQAIGTLAGGIAHDFNNILYAIKGYIEMAQEDTSQNTNTYNNLSKVLNATKRGQDLVARILAFSRRQHHSLQAIELKKAIKGALELLLPTIPTSVTINTKFSAGDFTILGNQTQLHQIMVNLVTNAVDAMEDEGTINVNLNHVEKNDQLIGILTDRTDNQKFCRLTVKDTGHGIDTATIERIFEPFFTTKEVGRGTGLGLPTVHSIVKEHKGEIMVESQPGHGATFTLLLPMYEENGDPAHGKNTAS